MTADTHHVDGYLTQDMEELFDEQYKNVFLNSNQQVYDLISWVKVQDFYENTSIVISGDHHTRDLGFIELRVDKCTIGEFTMFLVNSIVDSYESKNRTFATFDFFQQRLLAWLLKLRAIV